MNNKRIRSKILVVDDSETDALLFSDHLSEEHDVFVCTNGADALDIVKSSDIDLVLLDILMPAMDGYEVCRRLKANPATSIIPVIFITVQMTRDEEIEGFRAGAVDYIRKPVSPLLVKMRVQNYLELKNSHDIAVESLKYKIEFLARVGHEIRTPMHVVKGMTDLILNTRLSTRQHSYLKKISSASQSLLRIIEDILDLTKIEIGRTQLSMTDFRLDDVLIHVTDLTSFLAEKKGLDLIVSRPLDVPGNLVGDPTRLGQVLINLIGNAIKFTRKGEVVIRVDVAGMTENSVSLRFVVQDTGMGLSPQDAKNLFLPFRRGTTPREREDGFGLGLHISKHIVEMMGGSIHVNSKLDNGSIFSFTANFSRSNSSYDQFGFPPQLKGKKALVADGNQTFRKTICDTLQAFSFETHGVASSMEALDEISAHMKVSLQDRYSVIFLDLNLPDMDGIELAKVARERYGRTDPPKIFLMSYAGDRDKILESELLLFTDIIIKPVHPVILREILLHSCEKFTENFSATLEQSEVLLEKYHSLQGCKLLLANNESLSTDLPGGLFKSFGIAVTRVGNGNALVSAARQDDFDFILVNIDLPIINGLEATRILRRDTRFKKLPILAFSRQVKFKEKEELFITGIDDHIELPIKADGLFQFLTRWIAQDTEVSAKGKVLKKPLSKWAFDVIPTDYNVVDGNKNSIIFVFSEFKKTFQRADRIIQEALGRGDIPRARETMGRLKKVAVSCGAEDLLKAVTNLETAIDNNENDNFLPLVIRIRKRLISALAELEVIISESQDIANQSVFEDQPVDREMLKPLFTHLFTSLAEKSVASEKYFNSINSVLGNFYNREKLELIGRFIASYDYHEAHDLLLGLCYDLRLSCETEITDADHVSKLLIVDDDENNIIIMTELLAEDYRVHVAKNGLQALEIAHSQLPDLILLDISLPGMDGYEVCKHLKNSKTTCDIPVIFVSAMARDIDEIDGLKLGAVDYITKPFHCSSVKSRIKNTILFHNAKNKLKEVNENLIEERNIIESVLANMRNTESFDDRNLRCLFAPLNKTMGDLILSSFRSDMAQHVMLGDFTGHGLTAAIGSPLVSEVFYAETARGLSLDKIFLKINRVLFKALPVGLFMTGCCLELDPSRTQLTVWNGGQPDVLFFRKGKCIRTFPSSHIPRGMVDRPDKVGVVIDVERGDKVVVYSDGIVEERNNLGEVFGVKRLIDLLESATEGQDIQEVITTALSNHRDSEKKQGDDITLLELTC